MILLKRRIELLKGLFIEASNNAGYHNDYNTTLKDGIKDQIISNHLLLTKVLESLNISKKPK